MERLPTNDSSDTVEGLARFDIQKELAECQQKKPWVSGICSRTLFKQPDLRCVLLVMASSAKIHEHHADGSILVHVLNGRLRFRAQGKEHDLSPGNLLTLAASIPHDVEALEDSAFLLTISWPSNQELLAMKHRGYGN